MARRRIDFPGGIHHVMNRGVARQPIFFDDRDRVEFGARLAAIHDEFGVETLAYCLMDNHFHVLLHTPQGQLSSAMQHLGSTYTRHTNARVGRDGPLFRGRFHSIVVTTDRYLQAAARYIHRNPLVIPGIDHPADWRWSSYRSYLGLRRTPSFLRTDFVLPPDGDPSTFRALTEQAQLDAPILSGFDDLLQVLAFEIARVDLLHGADDAALPHRMERAALLRLLPSVAGSLATEIERYLGDSRPDSRRMAIVRADRRFEHDPYFREVVTRLQTAFAIRPAA